jgi:hypothetical protein
MDRIRTSAGPLPSRPHRAGALTTWLIAYVKWSLLAAVKSVLAPALSGCAPETRGQMCPNVLKCAKSVPIAPGPLKSNASALTLVRRCPVALGLVVLCSDER